jgi:hypothetical protein
MSLGCEACQGKAGVFIPGKPLLLSVMCFSETVVASLDTFRELYSRVGSSLHPQTSDQVVKLVKDKLQCLSLASLYSLLGCVRARQKPPSIPSGAPP